MVSINSLIKAIQHDHPDLTLTPSEAFSWSPSTNTIYYVETGDAEYLLHELAHASLDHVAYRQDIELLGMERDAWTYAVGTLASRYDVAITDDIVQTSLDTYRDWLHRRSTCPTCKATGIQSLAGTYACPHCRTTWHASEAKFCQLKKTVAR